MSAPAKASYLTAVHQDQLLEAMGAGFLLPASDDIREGRPVAPTLALFRGRVPDVAYERARGERRHGVICLVEITIPNSAQRGVSEGSLKLPFPIPLSWVKGAILPDEHSLAELRARAATFPDVVGNSIALAHGSHSAFRPSGTDSAATKGSNMELALDVGEARRVNASVSEVAEDAALDGTGVSRLRTIDKVGGALVGLIWGKFWESALSRDDISVGRTQLSGSRAAASSLLSSITSSLLQDATYASDRALLDVAASKLEQLDVADGIDPAAFLAECVEDCLATDTIEGEMRRDLEEFRDGASGVLGSRIELKPEALRDAMHIGARALLVFLLNPTQAALERFLARRPGTGPIVGLIAKTLVGVYNGLAAMPKDLKGATPHMLGQIAECALRMEQGEASSVTAMRELTSFGGWRVSVVLDGAQVLETEEPGDPQIANILGLMSQLGAKPSFDPLRNEIGVSGGEIVGPQVVRLRIRKSRVRLPGRDCFELACALKRVPTALRTKEGLLTLLDRGASDLVSYRISQAKPFGLTCSVLIEEESINQDLVREALRELMARVKELTPAAASKPKRSGVASGTPRRRKPKPPQSQPND